MPKLLDTQFAMDRVGIGIAWVDVETGRYLYVNSFNAAMLGYTVEEMLRMGVPDVDPNFHPEAYAQIRTDITRRGQFQIETTQRKKNGELLPVEVHIYYMPGNDDAPARFISFQTDITRRKEAERTLVAAKDNAEAASRAKSVFLSNMSHELRTPLNAILGFSQLMERDGRVPEDVRANLRTINQSGRHLLTLINDILEISRIEAGRLTVTPGTINLPGMLGSLVEAMSLNARDKGLDLRLELPGDLPSHIDSDAAKLRQILLNLLSNAIKYTRAGEIVVSAHSQPLAEGRIGLEVAVRDTGIGIAAADLERIFSAFYQTDAGIRQGEGTGLGLAISREYARLLGGELGAESTPGQGSVFRLRVSVDLADAPVLAEVKGRVRALSPGQQEFRILVVEDDGVNQEVLRSWLEEIGFAVAIAADGQEAVARFQSWRPHFIWMDMRMPVMDGFAATRAIRSLPEGRDLPIVAFTASAFAEDRTEILAAGCNDVMTKPLDEGRMFDLLAQYLPVRFDYDTVPAASPASASFAMLPAEVRQRLVQATQACDVQAIREIAQELNAEFPAMAQPLRMMADSYRFDLIDEALAATHS